MDSPTGNLPDQAQCRLALHSSNSSNADDAIPAVTTPRFFHSPSLSESAITPLSSFIYSTGLEVQSRKNSMNQHINGAIISEKKASRSFSAWDRVHGVQAAIAEKECAHRREKEALMKQTEMMRSQSDRANSYADSMEVRLVHLCTGTVR